MKSLRRHFDDQPFRTKCLWALANTCFPNLLLRGHCRRHERSLSLDEAPFAILTQRYAIPMRITQVKIARIDGPNVLGYAEITIDDCFCVRDLIIFRQPRGYRIAMPRVKLQSGRYKEIASALDAKTRKIIEEAVIAEYERGLANEHGER